MIILIIQCWTNKRIDEWSNKAYVAVAEAAATESTNIGYWQQSLQRLSESKHLGWTANVRNGNVPAELNHTEGTEPRHIQEESR